MDDDLLEPWRALGRPGARGRLLQPLQDQVLAQVVGSQPLAEPADGKVIVAGDWHGDASWAAQVVSAAGRRGVRTILQLGDFGFWSGHFGAGFLDAVEFACSRAGVIVCWLDGNHEDHDLLLRYPVAANGLRPVRPHVWHLPRGHRWVWDGRPWVAVGGAVSVDRVARVRGKSWWAAERLTQEQAQVIMQGGSAAVLLCHDRPSMVAQARGQTPGSWHADTPALWDVQDLRAADDHAALLQTVVNALQPGRLLHGHLHQRYDVLIEPTPWGGRCLASGLADQDGGPSNTVTLALDEVC